MSLISKHLIEHVFKGHDLGLDASDPSTWDISLIKNDNIELLRTLTVNHIILTLEYSWQVERIDTLLAAAGTKNAIDRKLLLEYLYEANVLAKLLEFTFQELLGEVPREVARFKKQKELCQQLITKLKQIDTDNVLAEQNTPIKQAAGTAEFSNWLRIKTMETNLVRLLLVRSKRLLNVLATFEFSAEWYRRIMGHIDKHLDPILPHITWFFYVPRLVTNLTLLAKHYFPWNESLPWFKMNQKQKDLGYNVRLQGQLLRRWFEIANDLPWVVVGIANCFLLTGALAPIALYLTIAFFGYDVVVSLIRTYIELGRLYKLREQYQQLATSDAQSKSELDSLMAALNKQLSMEKIRLISHGITTSVIFFAMFCALPMFAATPIIPLIGAIALVSVCIANFILFPVVEHKRPKLNLDAKVSHLSFFKPESVTSSPPQNSDQPDIGNGNYPEVSLTNQ